MWVSILPVWLCPQRFSGSSERSICFIIITPSPLEELFKEMLTHDECLLELSVPSGHEVPLFIEKSGPVKIKTLRWERGKTP